MWWARPFRDMLLVVIELARARDSRPRRQTADGDDSLSPGFTVGAFFCCRWRQVLAANHNSFGSE
jgi:hypothetical protein